MLRTIKNDTFSMTNTNLTISFSEKRLRITCIISLAHALHVLNIVLTSTARVI